MEMIKTELLIKATLAVEDLEMKHTAISILYTAKQGATTFSTTTGVGKEIANWHKRLAASYALPHNNCGTWQ